MSYDLAFWRQEGITPLSAEAIRGELLQGKRVEGLADLDRDGFLTAILESFPGATRKPNGAAEWIVWATATTPPPD
jgi:hypothetical protein